MRIFTIFFLFDLIRSQFSCTTEFVIKEFRVQILEIAWTISHAQFVTILIHWIFRYLYTIFVRKCWWLSSRNGSAQAFVFARIRKFSHLYSLGELQRLPAYRPPPHVRGALGGASAPTAPPTAPPTQGERWISPHVWREFQLLLYL